MGRAVRWLWGLSTQPVQLPRLCPALLSSAGLLLLPEKGMPGATKCLFSSAGWSPPARGLMVKSHLRDTYRTMVLGEGKQEQHQKAEATQ